MVDLEEERDALLRAIHELDNRADLSEERRAQLRTRYEAKAARVLRQIDERSADPVTDQAEAASPPPGRRVPWGGVILALTFVRIAAGLRRRALPPAGHAPAARSCGPDPDT